MLGAVKGRIDHMAFDALQSRLFVAELESNSLGIVDLKQRKVVHVITGLAEPQGVGYEPSSDTLYVANGGDGSVRLFRGTDYAETGRIGLGDDADNVRVDPATNRVLVGYGSGAVAAIDPVTRTKVADFPLPAHPEGFQIDRKTNRIFVNVPRSRAIVMLDGVSGQQKATWPVRAAGANFPMALDEDAQRPGCLRSPAKLESFRRRCETVASVEPCGMRTMFLWTRNARSSTPAADGFLDVLSARDRDYPRLARLPTARRPHVLIRSAIDRLFLAVRSTSKELAAMGVSPGALNFRFQRSCAYK